MQKDESYSIFQQMLLSSLKDMVLRYQGFIDAEIYGEVKEIIDSINKKANYGRNVRMKSLTNGKPGNEELKCMELGHIACSEEESDYINRVNKSREIEKEFTEKKIKSVLLSNKETKKAVKERSGVTKIVVFYLITMLLYVSVPISMAIMTYVISINGFLTSIDVANYVAGHYRFAQECSEAFNGIVLIGFFNKYYYQILTL